MSRVIGRPIVLAGDVVEMSKRLPVVLVWCVAATVNALIWAGLCRVGFWLVGSASHGTYVPAIFVVVTVMSFACLALLASGRGDR